FRSSSAAIAAINRVKAELPALNREGAQIRLSAPGARCLALRRLDGGHPAADHAVLVLANPGRTPVTLDPRPLLARAGGFAGFADRTPDTAPLPLEDGEITLPPWAVRIYAAANSSRRGAAAPRPALDVRPPGGDGRVVIERVWPELDARSEEHTSEL